tara:strand:- start:5553 stop:5843 length:291 start_codon:yes stop_codon:yes gene_type:complete
VPVATVGNIQLGDGCGAALRRLSAEIARVRSAAVSAFFVRSQKANSAEALTRSTFLHFNAFLVSGIVHNTPVHGAGVPAAIGAALVHGVAKAAIKM